MTRRSPPGARKVNGLLGNVLTTAVVTWFLVLVLMPALSLVRGAFANGLAAFAAIFAAVETRRALGLTLAVTLAAAAANAIFGLGMAFVLTRQRFRGATLIEGLIDLPFAVSPIVAGLMLVLLYGPQGLVGRSLESIGLQVAFAWPGMVLASCFVTLPLVLREILPVLRECGVDQEEAARTLGASRGRIFWQVTLPAIRWGLAYGIILTIARSLGEFGALLVVAGNVLGRTQTATLLVHDQVENFDLQGAQAVSVALAATSFLLLFGVESLRKRIAAREDTEDTA